MARPISPLLPALLAVLASSLPAASVGASETPPPNGPGIALAAAFYNDASCLLTIDGVSRIGRTQIDASLGGDASRMLIHCDTRDDRRLTLLARGEQLGRDVRMDLLPRADVKVGTDGVIAWLTRGGTTFADESAPRRYVTPGHVIIRELPTVQVDGTALHSDRTAFARVSGTLQTLLSHPGGGELVPSPDCAELLADGGTRPSGSTDCPR